MSPLTAEAVRGMLPAEARIAAVTPMNISNNLLVERIAYRLPLARHLARMILMCGYRRG